MAGIPLILASITTKNEQRNKALFLPERDGNTNFFPTLVYIIQKNIWDEKRYSLSNDIPLVKVKSNPITEAKNIEAFIAKNSSFSKSRIARKLETSRARVTLTEILQ